MGLSWKPVRRGLIYCAPACGGDCTLASYRRAVESSDQLALALGSGWKPEVHENLGWYYSVGFGKASVSLVSKGYWCSLYVGHRQFTADSKSPRKAFLDVLAQADEEIAEMVRDRTALEKAKEACQ